MPKFIADNQVKGITKEMYGEYRELCAYSRGVKALVKRMTAPVDKVIHMEIGPVLVRVHPELMQRTKVTSTKCRS